MQVSFNPVKQNYYNTSFKSVKNEEDYYYRKPAKDEILTAKTKRAVSECKYIAFAAGIMYFAMKRNFKVEKIKNYERWLSMLARMKVPELGSFSV